MNENPRSLKPYFRNLTAVRSSSSSKHSRETFSRKDASTHAIPKQIFYRKRQEHDDLTSPDKTPCYKCVLLVSVRVYTTHGEITYRQIVLAIFNVA